MDEAGVALRDASAYFGNWVPPVKGLSWLRRFMRWLYELARIIGGPE